ncbi:hypothetical protein PT974_03115 [Cladobotryum mycophilum]|uniref:Uncharacterized protein n=1 Tax=Cladobotryum mycophilum TaxID=491253 RepID=A0ABR0SRD7_9HYPO
MSLFSRFRRTAPGNQAHVDPHQWQLPSYTTSKSSEKQPLIPDPKIFTNGSIPSELSAGNIETLLQYPNVSHAAVHLALLECFRKLRLSAVTLDVEAHYPPAYEEKPTNNASSGPTKLPESQRWDLLVRLAVARFAAWWSNIDLVFNHALAYARNPNPKAAIQLTKDYIPPLDVLLVWYTFMLDSDSYRAACCARERDIPRLQQLCFPWPAIRDAIDMEKLELTLSRGAQNLFSTLSGQSADILAYLNKPPAYADADSLPFGVDLFSEVKKHESFMERAHSLLWIRAPALNGSLERASTEYFDWQLKDPSTTSIASEMPFGVDLFWRTHRLFPSHYELFLLEIETIEESSEPKQHVSQNQVLGSEPENRSKCSCWTCERIRENVPTFVHIPAAHASSSSSSSSTHAYLTSLPPDQLRQIQDDLGFYHAVEGARARGDPLPTRPATNAERVAERTAKEKQTRLGYLPGLHEYVEVLPDGRRKIRKQKHASPWAGLSWAT